MRQGSNSKRPRGKGGNRGANGARNVLSRSYDSNGPAGKVRGNPHQVHEKYLSLARDAQAEDPILAENLLQHADHYFRIIAEASGNKPRRDGQSDQDDNRRDDGADGDDSRSEAASETVAAESSQEAEAGGADDAPADPPKRTRRPRRAKAQEPQDEKSEEVASDAA